MHSHSKHDAQKTEEAGLTAEAVGAPSVANPDVAAAPESKELDRKAPAAPAPSLDRLDKERAAAEGMVPPSSP